MFKNSLFISTLLLLSLMGSSCATPDKYVAPRYNIYIGNIDARSLLLLLADLTNINIVIGDEVIPGYTSIDKNDVSVSELFAEIVLQQRLSLKNHNKLLMIASECRLENTVGNFIQLNSDTPSSDGAINSIIPVNKNSPLSVNFQETTIAKLISLYSEYSDIQFTVDEKIRNTPVTIRLRQKPLAEHLSALAAVQGLFISNNNRGHINITSDKALRYCNSAKLAIAKTPVLIEYKKNNSCLAVINGKAEKRVCEPAEDYYLENLKVLGYIKDLREKSRIQAIIQTPYETSRVSVGNYIGINNGLIHRITKEGIHLQELVREGNVYRIKKRFIPYA